jgi:hypothetical protein
MKTELLRHFILTIVILVLVTTKKPLDKELQLILPALVRGTRNNKA